jgi:outer membrane protein OmpA-like peptidoglycan-associated protein
MKTKLFFILSLFLIVAISSSAQVKVDVKKKVNDQANSRANQHADKAIDDAFNRIEDGIGSLFKRKKKNKKGKNSQVQQQQEQQAGQNDVPAQTEAATTAAETKPATPEVKWDKFDFVPGDQVIFEDAPSSDEENGEFPSRWDLYKGNAEIGEVDGKNVIMFLQGGIIVPYLKNSKEDYLPEIFTVEFDVYFKPGDTYKRYWVNFYDKKNQSRISDVATSLEVYVNGLEFGASEKRYPGTEMYNWGRNPVGGWKHISVAYTKGKFKAYMDDTRLINIPHLEGNPMGITIQGENADEMMYLRNVRIAKGGVKYYDRVLSDGKIIVNGIRFDVNKATIKPQSNGAINKIFKLMQKQPDLRFSVEGHTDSDGDEAANLKLSKARGKAVMDKLISMGIAADRLKYDGFGESKPIADNGTAEGKANNRRVEFVKF